MYKRVRWCCGLLVLLMAGLCLHANAQQAAALKPVSIVKGESDSRDYRYLTLPNNLRVLLISDSAAEKSAAALNIHIGSHQNPKQRPGLAHFLEHMLFLGTEKYPQAGEYQEFISQHGGHNNAYTAKENTSYFFDIENTSLESALDRFAQFFIAPVFDANYIEHEKNAVNAEYLAKINDDERRQWDAIRGLLNPEHPAAVFTVGNLATLADQENHSIHDDLVNFYHSYYSANLMTLVVVGNKKLDDLQRMVESRFGLIPNRNVQVDDHYPPLFSSSTLPASLSIKPVKEVRELSLLFPVPDYSRHYKTKPLEYLGRLLGDESSGSVLALLKGLGWAEALKTGMRYESRRDGMFEVTVSLTREGVKARDQIVSVLFDYLKLISAHGISDWRFNELQQMGDIDFRFQEKSPALETVRELAQSMQDYSPQDALNGKYNHSVYDEALIKNALGFLNKDNVLVMLTSPDVMVDQQSEYYQTGYYFKHGIPDVLELKQVYHQKLSLPERNVFIPHNTAVKAPAMLPQQEIVGDKNIPSLLVNSDDLKLWFLQDKNFRSPRAELNFRFKLPALNGSLENAARTQLLVALITDQLSEYSYPANLAGLSYSLQANARGFDLNIKGYTDRQGLLVNKILLAISEPDFSPVRYEKIKEDLLRQWRNEDKNIPFQVLIKKISRLQFLPYWGDKEYIESVQKTNFEVFKVFAQDVLRGAKIEALFYGNLYPQDAIKQAALIDHRLLQKRSNHLPQLAKVLRVEAGQGKSWLYSYPLEHHDHAVALYIQALSPGADDAAQMLLLNQILRPSFFNQLRTEKQLGYVVSLFPDAFKNVEGGVFVVQSPGVNGDGLIAEINNFMANAKPYIADHFTESKSALLTQLREPAVSLSQQSEKYWHSITMSDYEFSHEQDLINAVNRITLESLQKYYDAAFLLRTRQLWLTTDRLDSLADYDLIQNVAEYQQKQKGYLYP